MTEFEEQDYTKQLDLKLWIKIFGMMKRYRKEIIFISITMVFIAACDAAYPLLSKFAIDQFIAKETLNGFPAFVAIYIGVMSLQAFLLYFFIMNAGRLECGVVYSMRKAGFDRLQELSFSYYDKTPVGWIMARMTSDAQRIGDVISWSLVDLVWGAAMIIIVLVCMFVLNVKLALISLAVFPVLMAVSVVFQRIILKNHRQVRKLNSMITGAYNEGINGARTTKTLVREERNFMEFTELSGGMRMASCRAAIVSAVYLPVVMSLSSILVGLVLWIGGVQVQEGIIWFGTYSAFIAYTFQMFDPVHHVARVFSELQSAQAAAERTVSLIETEPEIKDRPEIIEKYGGGVNPKTGNWPEITGDIVFDNVSFAYSSGEQVLEGFNLHVKAGERIALVGETGAGKSTIVNLICRFYEPTAGEIRIDGIDYRERSQIWLQSNLGYVLQTPHLFSGTVADNIRYAKLDAADEEVINAARTVHAYDFIMKLDKGFDSEVGEGGGRLSSGQKQLISFARAIIANPRIFVLDEATSSIDTETERLIQEAVNIALRGRTSFIVAHRLSTIRSCDRILLIHDGKIAESGSHRELLRLRGAYYNLYTNQFREEAELKVLGGLI